MEVEKEVYKGQVYQDGLRKRIPLLIEAMNMGFNNFARHSNVCDKTVRAFLKDDSKILSMLILRKFEANIEGINPDWLWNGEGDMFLNDKVKAVVPQPIEKVTVNSKEVVTNNVGFDKDIVKKNLQILLDMLEITPFTFDKKVGLRIGTISSFLKGNKELRDEDLDNIVENLKVLNPEWLRFGKGSMILFPKP